jgi:hypothetical protein
MLPPFEKKCCCSFVLYINANSVRGYMKILITGKLIKNTFYLFDQTNFIGFFYLFEVTKIDFEDFT